MSNDYDGNNHITTDKSSKDPFSSFIQAVKSGDSDTTERLCREAEKRGQRLKDEMDTHIQEKIKVSKIIWQSGVSERDLIDKRWDSLEVTDERFKSCVDVCRMWNPDDHDFGLFIHGKPGNGKTHLMKCIALSNYTMSRNFVFKTVSEVMDQIKHFNEREYIHQELVQPWGLVLDDFGTELASEFEQNQMFRILENRKKLGKYVFMTSNLTAEELEKKYHPRIVSRLGELMMFVKNDGPSYRSKKLVERREAFKELYNKNKLRLIEGDHGRK